MEFDVEQVIKAVAGKPSPGDYSQKISKVVIDSRQAVPGCLFVAFAGEQVDGHDFLAECAHNGAAAALVERELEPPPGLVTIRVASTLIALQSLAAWQRRRFSSLKTIGVTGSSGKTTTKELLAGVLAQRFSVFKSRGNHNNEIGLPLMIFELRPQHQWAVLEMGMNAPGEITTLAAIARPVAGIITNIGEAHMEHLGSLQAICEAKFELAQSLGPTGTVFLNGDDPWQRQKARAGLGGARIIFYGLAGDCDVWARNVESGPWGSRFEVCWAGGSLPVQLQLLGVHNVHNAIAAFAVGLHLGVKPEEAAAGLASVGGEKRRLQAVEISGLTLIDDSYNANPDSMLKALAVLGAFPAERRRVAFLGDMLELGPEAPARHRQVGRAAAGIGLGLLVVAGEFADAVKQGATAAGMAPELIVPWPDSTGAVASVSCLQPGDVVLVKGSLGAKMDEVVKAIMAGRKPTC